MSSTITSFSSAREVLAALQRRQISAREVLQLQRDQVERINPTVNALVSVDFERAEKAAAAADDDLVRGKAGGPLHGLPFAFKDTHEVAGWRTTHGSPLMAEHVSDHDDLVVERVRNAGAIVMGKTNVPEWAAGSHTFNPVFGTTRNPYDTSRSAGGSSGGAAAALATGMVALADGSDMGGSLRNPASFCNVVGFRPTPGRVPLWPSAMPLQTGAVAGPMARTVDDLALLFSVMAGPSSRTPLVLGDAGASFRTPPSLTLSGLRVAYSEDLGGAFPVEPQVRAVLREQRAALAAAGAIVQDAHPVLDGAEESFRMLRAFMFDGGLGDLLDRHPDQFKASLARNIRDGRSLSGSDIAAAMAAQATLYDRTHAFFDDYDVLLMPVSQVVPFDADLEYPAAVDGEPTHFYLDWMRSVYFISATACPAISMPAGFTPDGLPVGVQLVARQQDDARLLGIARAYEQLNPAGNRHPVPASEVPSASTASEASAASELQGA